MDPHVEVPLTSAPYNAEMTYGFNKCCVAAMISGFLILGFTGAANSESGFHAQSRNLPAATSSNNRDCFGLTGAKKTPGADYIPDQTVAPADIEPVGSENFPILRFDLGLGKRQKNLYISPGMENSRLRARDLSVGEVSVDTFNGEVALDGQPLTRTGTRYGC